VAGKRVKSRGCELPSEKGGLRCEVIVAFDPALNPRLSDPVVLPVGEKAHAISTSENFIEVTVQLVEREVFVHNLTHIESWLYRQGHFCEDSERTEVNNRSMEPLAIAFP
jgi:hypothetical protein